MATDAATTSDAAATNGDTGENHEAKPPTRLVLVRHGVKARVKKS